MAASIFIISVSSVLLVYWLREVWKLMR